MSNPSLDAALRQALVTELMAARRAVGSAKRAGDARAENLAREAVDRAKNALGERGQVWWDDGTPDYNQHMARNSPYAGWFAGLF